jgi:2-keto-4-pentenoate hydratase/2-oxohepta-3-ene-1,7-dioic acid hydratase in catechol pathway
MKLVRYGSAGAERPGRIGGDGALRDLSAHISDVSAAVLARNALATLARLADDGLPIVEGRPRLGPPVAGVGKIVLIGLNYRDHAAESGLPVPQRPVVFLKATTALSGPTDPVVMPLDARTVDWEVELGIVIGRTARYVAEAEALSHVAGYCVMNDVSERTFSEDNGGNWTKGKSCDTFGPMGPWLVTADEVPDPQRLGIWLEVNGKRYQNSNTANMVFGVAALVSYVSRFMTLRPGDVISSGTPGGVGLGQRPPVFLKPGDVMRLGIDGLGEQRLEVVSFSLDRLPP